MQSSRGSGLAQHLRCSSYPALQSGALAWRASDAKRFPQSLGRTHQIAVHDLARSGRTSRPLSATDRASHPGMVASDIVPSAFVESGRGADVVSLFATR